MHPTITKRYPFRYWAIAEKKGYCMSSILHFFPCMLTRHSWHGNIIETQAFERRQDATGSPECYDLEGAYHHPRVPYFLSCRHVCRQRRTGSEGDPIIIGGELHTNDTLRPLTKRRSGINTWELT